jgi:hypothetical protein
MQPEGDALTRGAAWRVVVAAGLLTGGRCIDSIERQGDFDEFLSVWWGGCANTTWNWDRR